MPVTASVASRCDPLHFHRPSEPPCCSAASAKSSLHSAKSMKHTLPTDWLTGWHMTSVAPGGIQKMLDGSFVQHTIDILSWEREREKKKEETTLAKAQSPGVAVIRCLHLGNSITYDEMRDKEPRLIVEAVHCHAVWELV